MTDGAAKPIVLDLGDGTDDRRHKDRGSIAVSPDGRYVAAEYASIILLWDLWQPCSSAGERQPLVPAERLNGHSSMVDYLTFAKSGRFLVSAGSDSYMRVWDMGHLGIAPAPKSLPSSSSSPKGAGNTNPAKNDRLVTGGGKQKSRCIMQFLGRGVRPVAIAVSPDGRWVAGRSWDGIMFWDLGLSSMEDSSSLHGESSTMNTAAVTGDREAVCRFDRTGTFAKVTSVDLSPVGNMLAAAYEDGEVMIWRYKYA